jgi:hypothetical protein
VAASNSGRSPSSVFPNCPQPQLPASNSNTSQRLNSSSPLIATQKVKVMLWPTVGRPVYLGVKPPSEAQDQIFITVRQLQVCWCRVSSLTRGRIYRLQLLLVLASAVILGSESHGTHDYILLSQIRDSPTWRARFPHLYFPGTGLASYSPMHLVLFSSTPKPRRATVEALEPTSKRVTGHQAA